MGKRENSYCRHHLRDGNTIPGIISLPALSRQAGFAGEASPPASFILEARALGAAVSRTVNGFETVSSFFSDPALLLNLPLLDEQPLIKEILGEIVKYSPASSCSGQEQEGAVLLRANGPYSVLASMTDPALLYRWLVKKGEYIHAALDTITTGLILYLDKAFAAGVRIVSLVDPHANPDILGEGRYREFAGSYLVKLLAELVQRGRIFPSCHSIHLCPHSSLVLERTGFITSEPVPVKNTGKPYTRQLLDFQSKPGISILGHQCIHRIDTNRFFLLYPLK
jgi:uroporphyrinogen-III decarboxylase